MNIEYKWLLFYKLMLFSSGIYGQNISSFSMSMANEYKVFEFDKTVGDTVYVSDSIIQESPYEFLSSYMSILDIKQLRQVSIDTTDSYLKFNSKRLKEIRAEKFIPEYIMQIEYKEDTICFLVGLFYPNSFGSFGMRDLIVLHKKGKLWYQKTSFEFSDLNLFLKNTNSEVIDIIIDRGKFENDILEPVIKKFVEYSNEDRLIIKPHVFRRYISDLVNDNSNKELINQLLIIQGKALKFY